MDKGYFVASDTELCVINSVEGEINLIRNHHKQSEFENYVGFAEKVSPKFMPLLTKNFLTNQ